MSWISIPRVIEEVIFFSLIVIESWDVVESHGEAILLTITIARIVSRIVATIVDRVLLGFLSFVAIENGVSVLVMEGSVIIVMGKANATGVLVTIVTVTVTTPRDSILLCFVVIESGMAFEVWVFIVMVMAVSDTGSVAVLMIEEGIFLGSLVVIEVAGMRTS